MEGQEFELRDKFGRLAQPTDEGGNITDLSVYNPNSFNYKK